MYPSCARDGGARRREQAKRLRTRYLGRISWSGAVLAPLLRNSESNPLLSQVDTGFTHLRRGAGHKRSSWQFSCPAPVFVWHPLNTLRLAGLVRLAAGQQAPFDLFRALELFREAGRGRRRPDADRQPERRLRERLGRRRLARGRELGRPVCLRRRRQSCPGGPRLQSPGRPGPNLSVVSMGNSRVS